MINTEAVIRKIEEYTQASQSENNETASPAIAKLKHMLTFVFNVLASKLNIKKDKILKEFINEMVDPDVNTASDWITLLDPATFVKAYVDFKNTAEWGHMDIITKLEKLKE